MYGGHCPGVVPGKKEREGEGKEEGRKGRGASGDRPHEERGRARSRHGSVPAPRQGVRTLAAGTPSRARNKAWPLEQEAKDTGQLRAQVLEASTAARRPHTPPDGRQPHCQHCPYEPWSTSKTMWRERRPPPHDVAEPARAEYCNAPERNAGQGWQHSGCRRRCSMNFLSGIAAQPAVPGSKQ